ncbi:MAG: ATP-binding protein [bacterium]
MRPYLLIVVRVGLAVFLVFATVLILYMSLQSVRSAGSLADLALQNTALALASSAEGALIQGGGRSTEEVREIFSDRVVAYAAMTDRQGRVVFHTNPRLVGSLLPDDEDARRWPAPGGFLARRIVLGTGLPAYQFRHDVGLPDGSTALLTLVLHTASVDRIVAGARRIWWTVGGVLLLLWGAGIASERIFTRQVRMQAELERRKQLALLGQMTAVLAHEIRNALGSIKGYAQWVDEKLEPADPKKAGLAVVLEGAGRIESLVQDLLLFSREEVYRVERVEPAPLVREAVGLLSRSWGGKVELDVDSGAPGLGDREKLSRVLANGIRNALQAMGETGELRISVRPEGSFLKIRIADSGPGIAPEEIPRLFTPFHTTKADGTGLGLAYSRKVMEGMGGTIDLANLPGRQGAVLTLGIRKAGEG